MKSKTIMLMGLCAALFGAGIGISGAQVLDFRCESCTWDFQACNAACDGQGGGQSCYAACRQTRRACIATFCP